MIELGKLVRVAVRLAWPGEASDFTPWLAKEDNLMSLGEELGLGELELVEVESGVGTYRADILARQIGSQETVVIENQFGKTDHGHLGQLLTYAAGVGSDGSGAKTVIWVAENFSEPHRAALDWLNKCTEPGIGFYGVELQLWRIGDSAAAPRFQVVSRPNDWQKKLTRESSEPTRSNKFYADFWTSFMTFCSANSSTLGMPDVAPDRWWLPMSIGRTGFHVSLNARKKTKDIECQLWIDGKTASLAFSLLSARKEEILAALGEGTQLDNFAANRCKIFETFSLDVSNSENWLKIHAWLKERGEAYVDYFTPIVRTLKLD